MYEHVKTGCKHIPRSEQPLQFQSGYFLNKPRIPSFSLRRSRQANPLQVPHWGPYRERYLLTGHFYISPNISLFTFPSESPVKEPGPCSLKGSPWTGILRHQSQWCIYSFISSFMYVCQSPQKGALLHMGKNIRSSYTQPHADGWPIYNDVRSVSPRTCGVSHNLSFLLLLLPKYFHITEKKNLIVFTSVFFLSWQGCEGL